MKIKILIGALIIATIIAIGVYFLIQKNIICTQYILDDSHKITEESKIPRNLRSPNDNSALDEIVIVPPNPNVMDGWQRWALYSKTENIFWVADWHGLTGGWYGPYKGKPCPKIF